DAKKITDDPAFSVYVRNKRLDISQIVNSNRSIFERTLQPGDLVHADYMVMKLSMLNRRDLNPNDCYKSIVKNKDLISLCLKGDVYDRQIQHSTGVDYNNYINVTVKDCLQVILDAKRMTPNAIANIINESSDIDLILEVSSSLKALGHNEQATQLYKKAKDIYPDLVKAAKNENNVSQLFVANNSLLKYYAETKQYDAMMKLLDEIREDAKTDVENKTSFAQMHDSWMYMWNDGVGNVMKTLLLKGEIHNSIKGLEKAIDDKSLNYYLLSATEELAKAGKKAEVEKIFDLNILSDDEKTDTLYYLALLACKNRTPEQQREILRTLRKPSGDKYYWYLPDNIKTKNDFALKLLSANDLDGAKEVLDVVDAKMRDQLSRNCNNNEMFNLAECLLTRYQKNLKNDNQAFLASLDNQISRITLSLAYAEQIITNTTPGDTKAKQDVRELLQFVYQEIMKLDINPGETQVPNSSDRIAFTYRNEMMWYLIGIALFSNDFELANKWLAESRELDAKLPKTDHKILMKHFEYAGADLHDTLWMQTCVRFLNYDKGDKYDAAIIAAGEINDPLSRYSAFESLAFKMLWEARQKQKNK
ncbi:MAG: hypothetical protein ACRC2T_04895, partial [Thermoguttaceae bacterium]